MRRFRFSLESVLKVRRQAEEARQRDLADAKASRDRCLLELARLEGDLGGLLSERGRFRQGRLDLNAEAWHDQRQRGLNAGIGRVGSVLRGLEDALEAARLKAVEAARERRVLEKLEESQLRNHVFKVDREEQGLLDDLAQRAVSAFSPPSIPAEL